MRIPKLISKLDAEPPSSYWARIRYYESAFYVHSYSESSWYFSRLAKSYSLDISRGSDVSQKSQATAGPDWFDLPKTNMTKELKRDLQLLHMRNVLDPKRHFKKENKKVTSPEFSQLGTIVEGPTEFFCARVPRKQRTRTLTAELLADQSVKNRFKSKYGELQGLKSASKKTSSKSRRHKKRR